MIDKLKAKGRTQVGSSGFTLIEIVIVLAIAGLIFLVVFQAISNTQRARRDAERRDHAAQVAAAIEQYAGNNRGQYPSNATEFTTTFRTQYFNPLGIRDPLGQTYQLQYNTTTPEANLGPRVIRYNDGYICDGSGMTTTGASPRNFALVKGLESGKYCIDNS